MDAAIARGSCKATSNIILELFVSASLIWINGLPNSGIIIMTPECWVRDSIS